MRSKQLAISTLLIATIIYTTACGGLESKNSNTIEVAYTSFELNSNTIHKNKIHKYNTTKPIDSLDKQSNQTAEADGTGDNPYYTENYNITLHKLTLTGQDHSEYYTIDNNDIIYRDQRFHDLYSIVKEMDMEYDWQTFLNFILKTNTLDDSDLWAGYEENYEEGEYVITVDEEISGVASYESLKSEYGEKVKWVFTLRDKSCTCNRIYGCNKYMLITSSEQEVTIDMNDLDKRIDQ